MKPGILRALILCAGLLFVTSMAMADRIPINGPITITQSGSYYVSTSFSTGGTAIDITTANVSVDLDGQVITCSQLTLPCMHSTGTNTTISNGKVVGGNFGIHLDGSAGVLRVENVTVQFVSWLGIYVQGDSPTALTRAFLLNNSIFTNADSKDGIYLAWVTGAEIKGNSIRCGTSKNQSSGIHISYTGDGSIFKENKIRNCDWGLNIGTDNNEVSDNVLVQNGVGIYLWASGNRITNNIASDSTGFGTFEGTGISVNGSYNVVESNNCTGNAAWGITIRNGTDNVYSRNRALGNGSGGYEVFSNNINAGNNY